jgi:sensor histidine kinase regulating citrate/malate metabolism
VRTELVSESQGKHVIQISVRDTGIGIPESAQSKLFNRFSQAKGLLRTSTRQTLHLLMHLSAPVSAFTLKVKSALISVDCVFSMTLLRGGHRHVLLQSA